MSNGHGPLYYESLTTGGYIYTCDCGEQTGVNMTTDDALRELETHLKAVSA